MNKASFTKEVSFLANIVIVYQTLAVRLPKKLTILVKLSDMIILGIETSCDETSAAILEQKDDRIQILSNVVASSASLQSKYGGIIPEQAAREQLKSIIPVIIEAFEIAKVSHEQLDAIAVTYGPGLIGSLLVGVETAKILANLWDKPLIPVNHLLGHFYANWISPVVIPPTKSGVFPEVEETSQSDKIAASSTTPRNDMPLFPCIGLLVSGGHTDLVLFKNHNQYEYLGGTRDDAAGECFDKCARLLGLPYPGGPEISKLAKDGNPKAFDLPRPMLDSKDLDFSFSGLKTAVANLVKTQGSLNLPDLCASIEAAIIEVLVKKTVEAAKYYQVEQIIVAGGVAANQKLVADLKLAINDKQLLIKLSVPPPALCTDNAAMIASAGFFTKERVKPADLQANPNLSLAY
jgi:N6-L-threonylcarbamoyladenine synthase